MAEAKFELECLRLSDHAVQIEPARRERAIFDENRHAYRCLPLTTANTAGWELLCPSGVTIEWNGGPAMADLTVTMDEPGAHPFAKSNFATGIVTFDLGWLFRTTPGYHLWAMGPVNDPKDGIAPMSGLIETDWLPYTFTMNWKMTRPGAVRFEKGEPFCFITPARIADVADCHPTCRPVTDDAELQANLKAWTAERAALLAKLAAHDPETMKHPWGRRYFRGEQADGSTAPPPDRHFHKLRANPLVEPPPHRGYLDVDGRLVPGVSTREITSAADAAGRDFLVVDDLLSASWCERLASLHAANSDRFERSADPFWQDRLLGLRDIKSLDQAAGIAAGSALDLATHLVLEFYGVEAALFHDVLHVVGWPPGMHMPPHADNVHPNGEPRDHCAHREFSGVLYLTDDFEGGGVYLPRQDTLIRPRRGMFVSLPAGLSHEHAVVRVESGMRKTMAFFLTSDQSKTAPRTT